MKTVKEWVKECVGATPFNYAFTENLTNTIRNAQLDVLDEYKRRALAEYGSPLRMKTLDELRAEIEGQRRPSVAMVRDLENRAKFKYDGERCARVKHWRHTDYTQYYRVSDSILRVMDGDTLVEVEG